MEMEWLWPWVECNQNAQWFGPDRLHIVIHFTAQIVHILRTRHLTGIRSPCAIKIINKTRYTKSLCAHIFGLKQRWQQRTISKSHSKNKCNDIENVSEWTDSEYYMVIVIGYLFKRLLYAVSTMILSSDCHFMHCIMNIRCFFKTLQHVSFVSTLPSMNLNLNHHNCSDSKFSQFYFHFWYLANGFRTERIQCKFICFVEYDALSVQFENWVCTPATIILIFYILCVNNNVAGNCWTA